MAAGHSLLVHVLSVNCIYLTCSSGHYPGYYRIYSYTKPVIDNSDCMYVNCMCVYSVHVHNLCVCSVSVHLSVVCECLCMCGEIFGQIPW